MQNLTVDLSKVALILWSGMLIISGSIWILSSQVRRLGDLMQQRSQATVTVEVPVRRARAYSSTHSTAAITRQDTSAASGRVTRTVAAGFHDPDAEARHADRGSLN